MIPTGWYAAGEMNLLQTLARFGEKETGSPAMTGIVGLGRDEDICNSNTAAALAATVLLRPFGPHVAGQKYKTTHSLVLWMQWLCVAKP